MTSERVLGVLGVLRPVCRVGAAWWILAGLVVAREVEMAGIRWKTRDWVRSLVLEVKQLRVQQMELADQVRLLVAQEDARVAAVEAKVEAHNVELLSEHRDSRGRFTKQAP